MESLDADCGHSVDVLEETMSACTAHLQLDENTHCTHFLGRGGSSDVWVAEEIGSGRSDTRLCVAKILRGSPDSLDRRTEERFRREIELLSQMRQCGVPQMVREGRRSDGDCEQFFLMEYRPGFTLKDVLRSSRDTPLPALLAHDITASVARTLASVHDEHGLLHRDVKPGNIFLCDPSPPEGGAASAGGTVLVLDFGFAKKKTSDLNSITRTGEAQGTPDYMAPEQIADAKNVDAAADVFGLGIVTVEMLTGRLPFPRITDWTQLALRLDRRLKPNLGRLREMQPDVASFVSAMLAFNSALRPPMHEVGEFFEMRFGAMRSAQGSSLDRPLRFSDAWYARADIAVENSPPVPSMFGEPLTMRRALEAEYDRLQKVYGRSVSLGIGKGRSWTRRRFLSALGGGVLLACGAAAAGFFGGNSEREGQNTPRKSSNFTSNFADDVKNAPTRTVHLSVEFEGDGSLEEFVFVHEAVRHRIGADDCIAMRGRGGEDCVWVFKVPVKEGEQQSRGVGFLVSQVVEGQRVALLQLPGDGDILEWVDGDVGGTPPTPLVSTFLADIPTLTEGGTTPSSWGRYYVYGAGRGVQRMNKRLSLLLAEMQRGGEVLK